MPTDLLYEIGVEEIPAGAVLPALDQIAEGLRAGLAALRLSHGEITTYGTPRRLAVVVRGLQERQEDFVAEVKGPPAAQALDAAGQPTPAALGFARKQGVEAASLERRPTEKGDFLFAVVPQPGRAAGELLPELLAQITTGLTFPKTMRWGESDFRFARPMRWLVALLGEEALELEIAGIQAGRHSSGHRVLGQKQVLISSPGAYLEALRAEGVIADHREREAHIKAQAAARALEAGGAPVMDEKILTEVNFLVEHPLCLLGSFNERYLDLPPEVVITVMQGHQKYFPVRAAGGALLPHFIVVCNSGPEAAAAVLAGNERVLRPRLEDAEFYFAEDMKRPLADRREGLAQVSFLAGLGTLQDKTARLVQLVDWLAQRLGVDGEDRKHAERAAELCKCDLTTMMIGDSKLGELQGIVGGYYARHSGEPEAVAAAIGEHYLPLSAEGPLPATVPGALLSLADKLDTLAAAFRMGQAPTGSADPLALRRQATGVIRILRERGWRLGLFGPEEDPGLVNYALSLLPTPLPGESPADAKRRLRLDVPASLGTLVRDRLGALWTAEGIPYDIARAVLSAPWTDVVEMSERARFLAQLRTDDPETFERLRAIAERPAGIWSPAQQSPGPPDSDLFQDPLEGELWALTQRAGGQVAEALERKAPDYPSVVTALLTLETPVHEFFAQVMVMADEENLRLNRLLLMSQVHEVFLRLADFTEIVQAG